LFVATTQATLGGEVIADGGASVTERGIVYSTSLNPTTSDTKVAMGSGLGVFSQAIVGLSSSAIYHVRAYAINSVGVSYGPDSTFQTATEINLPILTTSTPSLITTNSANLGGNIINDGGASVNERGIVFSTALNPTTGDNKVQIGSGTGSYSQIVTALTANTTYHVRAYAINNRGTAYGADTIFTTKAEPIKDVIIYTGFSPDGDGVNDGWVIENANELSGHTIIVYNVFGQEVFSQIGYDKAWDGTVDGNLVPSGEYYYLIKGDKVNKKGALLIKTIK
jgi:gliding motility-associated-like protein